MSVPKWCGLWVLDYLALGRRGQTWEGGAAYIPEVPWYQDEAGTSSEQCLPAEESLPQGSLWENMP